MGRSVLGLLLAGFLVTLVASEARAIPPIIADRWAKRHAQRMPWHGPYYHTNYGQPVALVVPPTARTSRTMSWGVAQTEIRPIYHQFGRGYPGEAMITSDPTLRPTPWWPSHTDQFGVYYVRGPW